ncbi:hypothetical protein ACH35V_27035 [Actinomadura sp. 1N219]|uniref:hypothetical protein n=1 Tax=Actinomadura sp. 1N219 TaxID=3375152 RepID=UPI003798974B
MKIVKRFPGPGRDQVRPSGAAKGLLYGGQFVGHVEEGANGRIPGIARQCFGTLVSGLDLRPASGLHATGRAAEDVGSQPAEQDERPVPGDDEEREGEKGGRETERHVDEFAHLIARFRIEPSLTARRDVRKRRRRAGRWCEERPW